MQECAPVLEPGEQPATLWGQRARAESLEAMIDGVCFLPLLSRDRVRGMAALA